MKSLTSIVYYLCDCGLAFEDEACAKPIADVESWKVIPALDHDFEDGKCTLCGAPDPNYDPAGSGDSGEGSGGDSGSPGSDESGGGSGGAKTGDDGNIALWLAVLLVFGGALAAAACNRRQ